MLCIVRTMLSLRCPPVSPSPWAAASVRTARQLPYHFWMTYRFCRTVPCFGKNSQRCPWFIIANLTHFWSIYNGKPFFFNNNPIETCSWGLCSYFLETKRSAVGSFCGAAIHTVSAVYAVVRLSVCHVRLEVLLCQNAQPHYSRPRSGATRSVTVSQIFPPHKKSTPREIYACSGGLLLARTINAPHLV